MKVKVYNIDGKIEKEVDLKPSFDFANVDLQDMVMRYVKVYLANQHQGTSHTKTRGQVRGGGKKPWAQKHTGNARAGSIRSPLWVGGGVAHGPKSNKIRFSINKELKSSIRRYLLSKFLEDGKINGFNFDLNKPSTKSVSKLVSEVSGTNAEASILVLQDSNNSCFRSFRNIKNVKVAELSSLNPFQLLSADLLLIESSLVEKILEN